MVIRTLGRRAMQGYFADMLSHGEPVLLTRFDVVTHVAIPLDMLPAMLRRRLGLFPLRPRPPRAKRGKRAVTVAQLLNLRLARAKRWPRKGKQT